MTHAAAPDVDALWMEAARLAASSSHDRNTQVGCVILAADGRHVVRANRFPRGVNPEPDARHARPAKYLWIEHAERTAVFAAVADGVPLEGSTAYVSLFPCCDCARALVAVGVSRIVAPRPDLSCERWGGQWAVVGEMLAEAGVVLDEPNPAAGQDPLS